VEEVGIGSVGVEKGKGAREKLLWQYYRYEN
jgi:hypothetical protein